MQIFGFLLSVLAVISQTRAAAVPLGFNSSGDERLEVRAYEVATSGRKTIWPVLLGQGGRNVVRYCYVDAFAKARLQRNIEAAIQVWIDALGGPASAATGHNLVFAEIQGRQAQEKFCCAQYIYYGYQSFDCLWDHEVSKDTLALLWFDTKDHTSTIGYTPGSNPVDDVDGRHHMYLGDLPPGKLYKFVHELGHIIGLDHEFQRPDRDQYLIFRCHKVRDFEPSFQQARNDPANDLIPDWEVQYKLCNEHFFAKKYDFVGMSFIEDTASSTRVNGHPFGAFDLQSIMMYDSSAGVDGAFYSIDDPGKCPVNPAECVLVRRGPGNGEPGISLITNQVPSGGDLAFIRRFYPWSTTIPNGPPPR